MGTSKEPAHVAPFWGSASEVFFSGTYVLASKDGECVRITLLLTKLENPVLSARAVDARRFFRAWLIRIGEELEDSEETVFTIECKDARKAKTILEDVDLRLKTEIESPISPRNVERILNISGRERNRWTNDGRLPSCLSRRASKAQGSFLIPFYSSSLIRELYELPELLKAWRDTDAAAARARAATDASTEAPAS